MSSFPFRLISAGTALLALLVSACLPARGATTISVTNHFAYAANFGWVDGRGDTNNGTVIGEYVCSGYLHAANVGWISLGSGAPANGIQYQNASAGDFGVNHDGAGHLRGFAYGANIGWINFESTGDPSVDLTTGRLSGYAYSANCGWISLSNAAAHLQTTAIPRGVDNDADGLADAWERTWFGSLAPTANGDNDRDGASNLGEYLAGTNPTDANDFLRITSFQRGVSGNPARVGLIWTSQPTRQYALQSADGPDSAWTDLVVFPWLGADNAACDDLRDQVFYRLRAFRPLTP